MSLSEQDVGFSWLAEAIAQGAEKLLEAVFDHCADGIFVVEPVLGDRSDSQPAFRYAFTNARYEQLVAGEARSVGRFLRDCPSPQFAERTQHHLVNCIKKHHSLDYQVSLKGAPAPEVLRVTLMPLSEGRREVRWVVGVCQTVPDRAQPVAATARLLRDVTRAIADSQDLPTTLQIVLRRICEVTGWSYGEAWIPNGARVGLDFSSAWYAPSSSLDRFYELSRSLHFPYGAGLPGRVWATRQPVWYHDLASQPEQSFLREEAAKEIGLQAALGIPVVVADGSDTVLAVLTFFMYLPQENDQQFIELIMAIAMQLGLVMQQRHTEAALRESQRQLAILIDSLPGIVFACTNDRHWSMIYLSEGCYTLTGYRSDELAGPRRQLTYNDITHPDDLPGVLDTINQAIAQHQPYVTEYRIRTKAGEERWLWEKGHIVYSSDSSEPMGLEGFITDITDRKRMEEALQRSEEWFRFIFEGSAFGIAFADLDGYIVDSNPAFQQMLQYSSQELRGMRFMDYTHPDDLGLDLQCWREMLRGDRNHFQLEKRCIRKDGQWLWSRLTVSAIRDKTGTLQYSVGLVEDITERKAAEEALGQKERFLRLVLDNIPQHIFWKDTQSAYLGCNQTWAIAAGLEHPDQAIGKTDFELPWTEGDAEAERQRDQAIIRTGKADLNRLEYKRLANGEQAWLSVTKLPIHDAEGNIIGLLGAFENITPLKEAEEKYRSIFENAVEGIFQTTAEGRYITANPMLARIYGYSSPEELIKSLTDIKHQLYVDPERRRTFRQLIDQEGAVWGFESQISRKDGSVIWISECARALYDSDGTLVGYEGTVEDISQRKQAEAELHQRDRLLQGVATATHHLLANPDYDTAIQDALAALGHASGVDRVYIYENHPHSETGQLAMSMRFEWTRETVLPTIQNQHWQNQIYEVPAFWRWYQLLSQGRAVKGATEDFPLAERPFLQQDQVLAILMVPILVDDEFWGYIGFDNCTSPRQWTQAEESILVTMAASLGSAVKRRRTEEIIRHQACHDQLTGLPNRSLFNYKLPVALSQAAHSDKLVAVMFLDLDRFKTINDTLGHAVGDELLKQVTQRLIRCIRKGDLIARWGGDEFTLLLPEIDSVEAVIKIAQRILEVLGPAFMLEGHELYATSSIGIALYPEDGKDPQTLLKNADAALYRVKDQGRNGYQFYTPSINYQASERLALENNLHHALERQEFLLYYQPQVDLQTGEVRQMEALLRWQHPEYGLVPPQRFICLAEETGLILPIGEWTLYEACRQARQWQRTAYPGVRVAVNLSGRQFQQPGLVDLVARALAETGLSPEWLELEITETTAMQNVEFTEEVLRELQGMGVRLSMDDFGTGYSSLAYLKKFPFHTLKIDRTFTEDVTTDPSDAAIITAMLALGRSLNLEVVAEGVETEAQLEQLRSLHCRHMQGYLFSPPLPAEDALAFLQSYGERAIFRAIAAQSPAIAALVPERSP